MKTIFLKTKYGQNAVIFIDKIQCLYEISETHTNIAFVGNIDEYIAVDMNIKDLFEMIKNAYYL